MRRVVDTLVAGVALVLLLPIYLIIAAAIAVEGGGSVIFTQTRVGKGGRLFAILKFRTMTVGATNRGTPRRAALLQLRSDPRCTSVGRLLRRSHLDELPQLYNVLAGDMTLIGPRPLVPAEHAIVSRVWPARANELPGITGAWQVGRSEQTTVAELIQFDQAYLAHRSAWRDLPIVGRTLWCIACGRGR